MLPDGVTTDVDPDEPIVIGSATRFARQLDHGVEAGELDDGEGGGEGEAAEAEPRRRGRRRVGGVRLPRRSSPPGHARRLLVVGLGNPGAEYARTRHNVGFDVVELLASRHGGRLKKGKERALVDEVRIDGRRVALAEPQTYMNDSGESVSSAWCAASTSTTCTGW